MRPRAAGLRKTARAALLVVAVPALVLMLVLMLALAGGHLQLWQTLDFQIFRALHLTGHPLPNPGLRLVDVPYGDDTQPDWLRDYRGRLASALTALAALPAPPRVVLLDVWLGKETAGSEPLAQAVRALQQRQTRVYGAVSPYGGQHELSAGFMQQHLAAMYTQVLDGYGHTLMEHAAGLLTYQRELRLPGDHGDLLLPALMAVANPAQAAGLPPSLVIPLGEPKAFDPQVHRLDAAGAWQPAMPAGEAPCCAIVGSLARDSDNLLQRAGPVLLAWAWTDLLAGKASLAREPVNHPLATLGLAGVAALVALGVYRLAFRVLRTRSTPQRWSALASATAVLALVAAAALLLAVSGIVLLGGRVLPLVLPLFVALAACVFARWSAGRWIAEALLRRELEGSGEERVVQYDVFVSYAHDPPENKAWVQQAIVAPLRGLRHADGRPLRVFFDESEIRVGRQWKAEIELALLGTRCFVPVYSERYFERPYCREEMELADQLRIEGRLTMLPVARQRDRIPERYLRKLQYLDASGSTGVLDALVASVSVALTLPAAQRAAA